jgi:vacuolar-type H+-ATPase subunit F/Vma7
MKITWMKGQNDNDSFKMFENMGFDVCRIEDLENTDKKLKELINKNYTTIVMTNEVAGFSENIIKKYNKTEGVNIIITPSKHIQT